MKSQGVYHAIAEMHRDEEAVSAAVATTLLFAGVLSIIGVMLATMIPVINELEGSIERNSMSTQMVDIALETVRLSENGMPGDGTKMELSTLEGKLEWQHLRGGMWMSAGWVKDSSLRIKEINDLDRHLEIRLPGMLLSSICYDDMRLGIEQFFHYRLPAIDGLAIVIPKSGLIQSPSPTNVKVNGIVVDDINPNDFGEYILDSNNETWISTSISSNVLIQKSASEGVNSGASLISPEIKNPTNSMGKSWRLPLQEGNSSVHLVSSESMIINWEANNQFGTETVTVPDTFYSSGSSWSKTFTGDETGILSIQTSSDANILLIQNGSGFTSWPSIYGSYTGRTFLPPVFDGSLILSNPSDDAITFRWGEGSASIPANDTLRIDRPPNEITRTPFLIADDPIQMFWNTDSETEGNIWRKGSLNIVPAWDTGRISGHSYISKTPISGLSRNSDQTFVNLQVAGYLSEWLLEEDEDYSNYSKSFHYEEIESINLAQNEWMNITSNESLDPLRIWESVGSVGLAEVPADGEQRCRTLGIRASGWIPTQLPWYDLGSYSMVDAKKAWNEGHVASSMKIEIFGTEVSDENQILGTAWSFQIPRLSYIFKSSISGLEVATKAGVVLTNHPDVEPTVLLGPIDRAGPGPRFAATVPMISPTSGNSFSQGELEMTLKLNQRFQLTSAVAHEVRRGWDGPYGTALTAYITSSLSHSEDWTISPMRLDLLNDYKGWVPNPTFDSNEAIYHAQGEPIQLSLQVSVIECSIGDV